MLTHLQGVWLELDALRELKPNLPEHRVVPLIEVRHLTSDLDQGFGFRVYGLGLAISATFTMIDLHYDRGARV